jgi:hypothetical protein
MVPALLYLLVKKYLIGKWPPRSKGVEGTMLLPRRMLRKIGKGISKISISHNVLLVIGFLLLMLLKMFSLKAQEQLEYKVVKNGKVVGWTNVVRTSTNEQVDIKLNSEVKIRFVFQFVVRTIEESIFHEGNLVYASQFRKLNGDVKEDKVTKLTSRGYEVYKGQDTQTLPLLRIGRNILRLYFEEPLAGENIYSDAFQQFIKVEKIADGGYRMNLPDGNSSTYYYKKGRCTNVKIDHRYYSAELQLSQN